MHEPWMHMVGNKVMKTLCCRVLVHVEKRVCLMMIYILAMPTFVCCQPPHVCLFVSFLLASLRAHNMLAQNDS